MKLFDRLKENEKGLTLYELLAAIVISGIALSSIYGVFITGVNLYKKIAIESQLKEEADFIVATVLNEFYSHEPSDVTFNESSNELSIAVLNKLTVNDKDFVTYSSNNVDVKRHSVFKIMDAPSNQGMNLYLSVKEPIAEKKDMKINEEYFLLIPIERNGVESPIFTLSCTSRSKDLCNGGVITVQFRIAHEIYSQEDNRLFVEPIEFKSEFGF